MSRPMTSTRSRSLPCSPSLDPMGVCHGGVRSGKGLLRVGNHIFGSNRTPLSGFVFFSFLRRGWAADLIYSLSYLTVHP